MAHPLSPPRRRSTAAPRLAPWIALALVAGCSEQSAELRSAGDTANNAGPQAGAGASAEQCFGANDCPAGYECNAFGYCARLPQGDAGPGGADAGPPVPAEVEEDLEPPASGKRYVYVAVADQDAVVKIDSQTLSVQTIKVGDSPGALQTVGGDDVAIVLNRGAASASLLRSRADGTDQVTTLPTVPGLNRLAVSPDGDYAVAFFDVARSAGNVLPNQTFQEITLLRLAEGKAVDLSVGFRPSDVQFSADSATAFVITEQGISVIALAQTTAPTIVRTVSHLDDPLTEPDPTEVQVTPDGKLALVRRPGLAALRAVDLATGAIVDVPLAAEPSDLDITPDGKLALVVLRDQRELALIDIPEDLDAPEGITALSSTHPFGQATLSGDGARAFLFTNATTEEVLLLADLQKLEITAFPLEKGVRAVRPAPDGKTALVLHNKLPGDASASDPFETFIDKRWGYSLLSIGSRFVKLQLTETDPGPTAFSADGKSAYLLLADRVRAVRAVEAIDLQSFLVDRISLGSYPAALGLVPATAQVYVAQSHALGRVTFIHQQTHQTRTLTGFALNSQVIE